jgi:hypothetical protein
LAATSVSQAKLRQALDKAQVKPPQVALQARQARALKVLWVQVQPQAVF